MKHAIEILSKELKDLNKPDDSKEDDLIGAILKQRNEADIKLALKILNDFLQNCKILKV